MPNLYATPAELKAAMPDGIRNTTTKYDALLARLLESISRAADRKCGRVFYPSYGIRYFAGDGSERLRCDDLVSAIEVAYSTDGGETFTALTASDWIGASFEDENSLAAYRMIILPSYSDVLTSWARGRRSARITGWWAYTEDRSECWENSGATLSSNYTLGAATLAVSNTGIKDRWGLAEAFQPGKILKVDDEVFECLATDTVPTPDTLSVLGGRNGSTAAAHSTSDVVYTWRIAEGVKQAAIIQAVRVLQRGLQGYGDVRANPELGQMQWVRKMDPDVEAYLEPFIKRWYR